MADPLDLTVLDLAELIRGGSVSAEEVVSSSLAAIERLEPLLNAFTHVAAEEALSVARGIPTQDARPFAGVPIAIKDNRAVVGMPLTFGSAAFVGYLPDIEPHFVARLRAAGFVIVGKTALPEGGIMATCEPRSHGPTANPWDLTRTPGGSSGGAAAAVASGMLPVAHGNDGGGSLRIPAACCGLVGLKPSRGRISSGPANGHSFLVSDGFLTRTVAETAALLDVVAGYELGDATWATPSPATYVSAIEQAPTALRIGVATNPPVADAVVDPECERGAIRAGEVLASLGHQVEEYTAPWSRMDLDGDFASVFGPGAGMLVRASADVLGRSPTADDFEPLTWALHERALAQGTLDYLAALNRLEAFARDLVTAFYPFDAVLTPALAERPLETGTVSGLGPDPWGTFHRSGLFTPFTSVVNVTGLPAITLPTDLGVDGLPTAVQLIGRPEQEGQLLALAAQLEGACAWSSRRPDVGRARLS